jgi:hypothetical protein
MTKNQSGLVVPSRAAQLRSADAPTLTPAEMRMVRMFRSVPEAGRPQFFQLMSLICVSCDWGGGVQPSLQAVRKGGV